MRTLRWLAVAVVASLVGCGGDGSEAGAGAGSPGGVLGGGIGGDAAGGGSARDSEIQTAEGIRLRFPQGFTPRVETGAEGTVYVAVREKEVVAASIREARWVHVRGA